MTTKHWIITVIVVGATGLAVGRFTVPVKTVVQTKTVEVASTSTKTDDKTNKKEHKDTKIVTTKKPDGTEQTTTEIVEDTSTGNDITVASNTKTADTNETKKSITKDSGHLNLSFLAGVSVLQPSGIIYGGHITRDILGPINIGVWGMSNGTAGLSAGLTF